MRRQTKKFKKMFVFTLFTQILVILEGVKLTEWFVILTHRITKEAEHASKRENIPMCCNTRIHGNKSRIPI